MDNEPVNTNENQNTESKEQQTDTKSLEARIKALEAENGKLKNSVTNASADASEWKKKYQATLDESTLAKEKQDEATAALQTELENLRKERNIADYTGKLVANDIGMDADTAKEVAIALNAGETDAVFDGIRKFIVAHDKAMRESALRNNKTLPGGNSTKTISRDEFRSMSLSEMIAFKNEHPDLYTEYKK